MARIDANGHGLAMVDRFATRSLCWQVRDGRLRVAARADELADESTDIDPQAIYNYLHFHCIPSPGTIFKGIYRLPAAHALRFDDQGVRVWRYWTPDFAPQGRVRMGRLGQMKKEPTMFDLPEDAVLYAALNARDPAYEGRAYVGVTSTGIFCRLTCPARKPRPENCRWFDSPRAAEAAGFRVCKRCYPIGATAVKLTVTIMGEMERENHRYGLVTMCVGGGQGGAMIVENLSYGQ